MQKTFLRFLFLLVLGGTGLAAGLATAAPQLRPQVWTWEQVKERLELNNPTLLAGKLNISELQEEEITAHFRPSPNLALLSDQIDPFAGGPAHGPFAYWLPLRRCRMILDQTRSGRLRL